MTNAAIKLDMCTSQTCMRENTGEKSPNKPGRGDLKQNNYHWFEVECKKKRTEYRKLKVYTNVMLIITLKEREHVRIQSIKRL